MFISLGSFTIYSISVYVSLTSTLGYVDPFLILVGGIAGLAYPEKPMHPSSLQPQNTVLERWKNLEVTEGHMQVDKVRCSQCGAENPEWAKFCKTCNSPIALEQQKITPPEAEFRRMQIEITDKSSAVRGMTAVDLESFATEHPEYKGQVIALLEKCLNDPNKDVRTSAKQSLDMIPDKSFTNYQLDAQETPRAPHQSSAPKVFCTRCGFQNIATAKFCKRCGAIIE